MLHADVYNKPPTTLKKTSDGDNLSKEQIIVYPKDSLP